VPKTLTRKQLEGRKEKAVRFVRDVLEDPERADEIEDESLEHYAQRRKISMVNPRRKPIMATKEGLKDRIRELEEENDDLQDQLDKIADIAAPIEDNDDDRGDEDDDRARPTARSNPRRQSVTGQRDIERTRRNAGR
jgi:hypothetical protein